MSSVPGAIITNESSHVFASIVKQSRMHAVDVRDLQSRLQEMRDASRYRAVVVAICMDERCSSFVEDTGAVPGYYTLMQTKGARLHMSNFQVSDTLSDLLRQKSDKPILMIFTVHFSTTHPDHGCAGWDSDTVSAFAHQGRVAEAYRRNYPGQIHTVVMGYDTDDGSLSVDFSEVCVDGASSVRVCAGDCLDDVDQASSLAASHLHCISLGVPDDYFGVGGFARNVVLDEIKRMFGANAKPVWHRLKNTSSVPQRVLTHSATRLYAGSGFGFDQTSGGAVHVGLYSSTFVDDVVLGIEAIILPQASKQGVPAYVVINREYDPKMPGEFDQARDWVHAVVEDVACQFEREIDAGELRIMESVSTLVEGMTPILTY